MPVASLPVPGFTTSKGLPALIVCVSRLNRGRFRSGSHRAPRRAPGLRLPGYPARSATRPTGIPGERLSAHERGRAGPDAAEARGDAEEVPLRSPPFCVVPGTAREDSARKRKNCHPERGNERGIDSAAAGWIAWTPGPGGNREAHDRAAEPRCSLCRRCVRSCLFRIIPAGIPSPARTWPARPRARSPACGPGATRRDCPPRRPRRAACPAPACGGS